MKKNNKIYITSLIFTLAAALLIVFFIWPLWQGISKDSKTFVSAKNDIITLGDQVIETENFSKNYESYKPNLEKIDQLFFDPLNPVDFIEFLESAAYGSQITSQISLPSASQGAKKTAQDFIIFQFSSKGTFSGMLNFAKKIETGPYLLEIENLTMQNSGLKEGEVLPKDYSLRLVDATFTIKVFVKK